MAAADLTALLLVAVAALAHASWNFLAKRAGGSTDFVAACIVMNVVLWAPAAIVLLALSPAAFIAAGPLIVIGSGLLHSAYWLTLNRGYSTAALSVVYPIARGSGAALAAALAILLFDETASAASIVGGAIIIVAILALGVPQADTKTSIDGHSWALVTGVLIAAYTLWDSRAVGPYKLSPIVFYWLVNVVNSAVLAPRLLQLGGVQSVRRHLGPASAVALLSTLSYVPVLYALTIAPVNIVAPAREISVLLGAAMGIELLGEANRRRRMLAAGAMVLGIIVIAIG